MHANFCIYSTIPVPNYKYLDDSDRILNLPSSLPLDALLIIPLVMPSEGRIICNRS